MAERPPRTTVSTKTWRITIENEAMRHRSPNFASRPARIGLLLSCLAAVVFAGCTRSYRLAVKTVSATGVEEASGAIVYVDGKRHGETPCTVLLEYDGSARQRVLVQVVKDGFRPSFQYYREQEVEPERVFRLEYE
jgi:hypothetical protein